LDWACASAALIRSTASERRLPVLISVLPLSGPPVRMIQSCRNRPQEPAPERKLQGAPSTGLPGRAPRRRLSRAALAHAAGARAGGQVGAGFGLLLAQLGDRLGVDEPLRRRRLGLRRGGGRVRR